MSFNINNEVTKQAVETEIRYYTLFESAADAIFLIKDGFVIECNQKTLEIFGGGLEGILNKSPASFSPLKQPNGADSIVEVKKRLSATLEGSPQLFEWQHKRNDGSTFDAEVSLNMVELPSGIYIQAIVRDISKKKEIEKELIHSRKMEAIGRLAGGIAHDFNNMLGGIMGAAEILRHPKRNLDDKNLGLVDIILKASKRAADLTTKLLIFGSKDKLKQTNIDLHQAITNIIALLKRTINKKISIHYNFNSTYNILGNISALESTLINICINASHAMPDGGELHITTKDVFLDKNQCDNSQFKIKPGKFIEIEIKDTGFGISEENLNKIFDPFFTTKKKGHGTGLGLATAYKTVSNHKGEIIVSSILKKGTSFKLRFPYSEKKNEKFVEKKTIIGVGNILLVDDEKIIRDTTKLVLEDMGYNVSLAEDGKIALKTFKKKTDFDLIIMDIIMPEMNGIETSIEMKRINKNCKIILLSGLSFEEHNIDINKYDLSGFIKKPVKKTELSHLLAKILNPPH